MLRLKPIGISVERRLETDENHVELVEIRRRLSSRRVGGVVAILLHERRQHLAEDVADIAAWRRRSRTAERKNGRCFERISVVDFEIIDAAAGSSNELRRDFGVSNDLRETRAAGRDESVLNEPRDVVEGSV